MAEGENASRQNVEDLLGRLKAEIREVVVGYEEQVDDFLICLLTDGHLLMEGVPGVAKTTLAKVFAQISGLSYRRIQFTQDLLPADITGHYYFNQRSGDFEVRKGPIFTNLLLADEINRAPPKTQSALLEAMQERQVTIEGNTFPLPDSFTVIATINPIETEGVYPLPEAQIDRFMIKSSMDYLDTEAELGILKLKSVPQATVKQVLTSKELKTMREGASEMYAETSVLRYIRDLARATRDMEELELGLSPRGAIHLLLTSKARAYIFGRDYLIPDDVKAMAHKVINHRLILTPEAELEGTTRSAVTDKVLSSVPVPKEETDFEDELTEE